MRTTEEVVRAALKQTYNRFDYVENTQLVERIVALLDDPSKASPQASRFESPAAYETRQLLLDTYRAGVFSVKATVAIFQTLDRHAELGWLAERN